MVFRLHDTASGTIRPLDAGPVVRMYTCGITPYDATHIGHATTFLAFDLLHRRLRALGHEVQCVRNVTDVDDSLLERAAELGVHYLDLAARGLARFDADLAALGLLPPWSEPRATGAIGEIRRIIGSLLEKGAAYEAEGHVFLDHEACSGIGQLSGLSEAEMRVVGAERGERPDLPGRRNELDSVLWQRSAHGEPEWDARWGGGRPGWHVECAGLALRELGAPIDIHGGGSDLVYPHHELERAQAETFLGSEFVRFWMHVGMVERGGQKMSKSLGNLVFVNDVLEQHDPSAVRLAVHGRHYRTAWEWHDGHLADAEDRLALWASSVGGHVDSLDEVGAALDDDLDAPAALGILDDAARRGVDVSDWAESHFGVTGLA